MAYEKTDRFEQSDKHDNTGISNAARDAYGASGKHPDRDFNRTDTYSQYVPPLRLTSGASPESSTTGQPAVTGFSSSGGLSNFADGASTTSPIGMLTDTQSGSSQQSVPVELAQLEAGILTKVNQLSTQITQLENELGVTTQPQLTAALPINSAEPATISSNPAESALAGSSGSVEAAALTAPVSSIPSESTAAIVPSSPSSPEPTAQGTSSSFKSTDPAALSTPSSFSSTEPAALTTPSSFDSTPPTTGTTSTSVEPVSQITTSTGTTSSAPPPAESTGGGATTPNTTKLPGGSLAMYLDSGNITGIEQASQTLGGPVQLVSALAPATDGTNVATDNTWLTGELQPWIEQNPNNTPILAVPLVQNNGDTLANAAAGGDNSNFQQLGQELVAAGLGNSVIRLGWEPNGNWYSWNATTDPQQYIQAFDNAVTSMRSVPGANFTFDWDIAAGQNNMPAGDTLASFYPGNAYVNDIGIDAYDTTSWSNLLNEPMGLNATQQFAEQNGKTFSVDEWGLWDSSQSGNGDDPNYINNMANFFKNTPNLLFQSYFNENDEGAMSLNGNPNSEAAYNEDFAGQ